MECSTPGRVQSQIGPDFEQPGLVEGFPAHGSRSGTKWPLKVPSNPTHSIILQTRIVPVILSVA